PVHGGPTRHSLHHASGARPTEHARRTRFRRLRWSPSRPPPVRQRPTDAPRPSLPRTGGLVGRDRGRYPATRRTRAGSSGQPGGAAFGHGFISAPRRKRETMPANVAEKVICAVVRSNTASIAR